MNFLGHKVILKLIRLLKSLDSEKLKFLTHFIRLIMSGCSLDLIILRRVTLIVNLILINGIKNYL